MNSLFSNSVIFGCVISLISYELGMLIKKKTKLTICNPLLISIILVVLVLLILRIDYNSYYEGAKYISYLLTPATVCLAVPLYEKLSLLRRHLKAVIIGISSGVLSSGVCIYLMALVLKLDHTIYASLIPKSITTAIGMGLSEEIGGIPTITIASILITGVFGNIISDFIIKLFKISEPIAVGIGLGTASHAIGTAKAMELGETEGAMSSYRWIIGLLFSI